MNKTSNKLGSSCKNVSPIRTVEKKQEATSSNTENVKGKQFVRPSKILENYKKQKIATRIEESKADILNEKRESKIK
jgi:hypothetical protein